MAKKTGSGGGNRKHGRNRPKCEAYKRGSRGEYNQLVRLVRHLRGQGYEAIGDAPADAQEAWKRLLAVLPNATIHAAEKRLKPPEPPPGVPIDA